MSTTIYGLPIWLVAILGILVVPLVIYLIVNSFREGREISFWPPRIGSRPLSDEPIKMKKPFLKLRRSVNDFFLEEFPTNFKDNFKSAQEIWIVGVTLRGTIRDFGGIIEEKLRKGHKIRVLLVHPEGAAIEMVTSRYYGPISQDVERVRSRIKDSLKSLYGLQQIAPDKLEIRTINNPLTFGAICINPETTSGVLYLEHFPFRTVADSIPRFVLQASDGRWYELFRKEIQILWDTGVIWKCTGE